jgi:tetratricopeptide (TPR) repeat protein
LLIADDVHWADSETLQLLRRLTRGGPEARMLAIAAFRDRGEEVSPALAHTLAEMGRLDGACRIMLDRLSIDEVDEFIEASTGVTAPEELAEALGELTGGTPLLLCELWRDLLETGDVEVDDDVVRLARPAGELRSPERIRDVVRQRVSRLSADAGSLLELAAVVGPTFAMPLIAEAARLDQPTLLARVDETVAAGMIEASGASFRFAHELVRRAVYDQITDARLAQLHLRVGEALEQQHESDPSVVLPELAHHFTIAAPIAGAERAIDYNLRAAEQAIGLDTGEALSLLERARALSAARDQMYPLVLLRWGEAASHAGRHRDAAEALDLAASSFEARGDARRAGESLIALWYIRRMLGEPGFRAIPERAVALLEPAPGPELVAALTAIADDQRLSGDNAGAVEAADRALTLAAELGLPVPGTALGGRGLGRCSLGDVGGFADIDLALELLVAAGQGRDAARLQRNRGDRRWWFDGPAAAVTESEQAEAFAAERGLVAEQQASAGFRVGRLVAVGRLDEALQLAAALLPCLRESGHRSTEATVLADQARALAEQGRDAREPAELALRILRDGDMHRLAPWGVVVSFLAAGDTNATRALLREAAAAPHRRGSYTVALPMLARAAATTGEIGLFGKLAGGIPEALRIAQHALVTVRAIQAEQIGEDAHAAALYAEAAGRWHRFTSVLEEAYALLGQGRCLTVIGDPDADQPLGQARLLFAAMGARPRVEECNTLITARGG